MLHAIIITGYRIKNLYMMLELEEIRHFYEEIKNYQDLFLISLSNYNSFLLKTQENLKIK